jgi:hypothetical protein
VFEECSGTMGTAFVLLNLTHISLREGDIATAGSLLAESLTILKQQGHRRALLQWIVAFATFHLLNGDLPRAISLLSVTQAALAGKRPPWIRSTNLS